MEVVFADGLTLVSPPSPVGPTVVWTEPVRVGPWNRATGVLTIESFENSDAVTWELETSFDGQTFVATGLTGAGASVGSSLSTPGIEISVVWARLRIQLNAPMSGLASATFDIRLRFWNA